MSTTLEAIGIDLYRLLVTGDLDAFHDAILAQQVNVNDLRCPKDKSTVLHIAAAAGQAEQVANLLSHWPDLMVVDNSKGDLPIHSALKFGKVNAAKALTSWMSENNARVLGWKNGEGSTAHHIALENEEQEIAKHLVDLFPPASYLMNDKDICPIYLAITKEFSDIVHHMLSSLQPYEEDAKFSLRKGKSLLHAAISAERTVILEDLLRYDPEMLNKYDEEGRTPLSYAAHMGYHERVRLLNRMYTDCAFIHDDNEDGYFPVHWAVLGGHISVMEELHNTTFLTTVRGHNVLHVAAKSGESDLVRYLLTMPEVDSLINQKDEDGNTPLHLAALAKHFGVVDIMIQDKRFKVGLLSKDGQLVADFVKELASLDPNLDVFCGKLSCKLNSKKISRNCFPIDSELYLLLANGEINQVLQIISGKGLRLEDLLCLEDKSNVLHIAATKGQSVIIDKLLRHSDSKLMVQVNDNGDLPLHTAAKTGKLDALIALCAWKDVPLDIFKWKNRDGNTALHIAMLNYHEDTAKYLFQKCPQAAYCSNQDKISPLFLAIRDKFWEISFITDMLQQLHDPQNQRLLKSAKSVVHTVIINRTQHTAILTNIIKEAPCLIESIDSQGRSPLSLAAYLGDYDMVQQLLKNYPELAFKRDKDVDGSFLIHQASKGGHIGVIKVFHGLTDTTWLLNGKHQNILHVAAKMGRSDVIAYLLKMHEFKELVNLGDDDGNTPLHLAVEASHPRVVYFLARETHIIETSTNKQGLRARDMLGMDLLSLNLDQQVIRAMLGAGEGAELSFSEKKDEVKHEKQKANSEDGSSSTLCISRESFNTDLLVATLIVTVTFAAGFTIPGGYNQSNPDIGLPTLAHRWAFQVFTICNITTFYA